MPVGQDVVVSITRVPRLLHRKDIERMAPDMSQVDDICRLWSERHDVSEIAIVTGHDRKTVCKYLRADGFSPEPPHSPPEGRVEARLVQGLDRPDPRGQPARLAHVFDSLQVGDLSTESFGFRHDKIAEMSMGMPTTP